MATATKSEGNAFAKAAQPFVCGGAAATFASIVIHPMDLAKVSSKHIKLDSHDLIVVGSLNEIYKN